MTALLRPGDTAARLGGDEFAILCRDTDPQYGHAMAERLRAAAAQAFRLDGASVRLTATVGISSTDRSAGRPASPAELVHRADQHMYAIKQRQRA